MNWCDIVVLGIIVFFGVIGLRNGFLYSIFKIAAFFIAIVVSIQFYPAIASLLLKTDLYTNIKASIYENLLMQNGEAAVDSGGPAKQAAADTVVSDLELPGFFKENLVSKIPNPTQLVDIEKIMDTISGELATTVISIISLALLYVLVRIGLLLLKNILKGLAMLPVFKQMDKLGGIAFGAVEGLLTIYIIFTLLMLFNATPAFKPVFEALDNSAVARYLYQHNFIVDWAFPQSTGLS